MENSLTTIEIYVRVPDEDGAISTQALPLGNDSYKVLARSDYNSEAEDWEFPPGSIVRCEWVEKGYRQPLFLATAKAE